MAVDCLRHTTPFCRLRLRRRRQAAIHHLDDRGRRGNDDVVRLPVELDRGRVDQRHRLTELHHRFGCHGQDDRALGARVRAPTSSPGTATATPRRSASSQATARSPSPTASTTRPGARPPPPLRPGPSISASGSSTSARATSSGTTTSGSGWRTCTRGPTSLPSPGSCSRIRQGRTAR